VDVQAKLDELTALVENARAMPMSASCIVNRSEVLAVIDELRAMLPDQLREAEWVLKDRDEVVEQGRKEAEKIVADARTEAARLVSRTEVMQTATKEAERITTEATDEATRMRLDVEDYVDTKLANFEVVLHKTLAAVERGRDKLRGRHELASLAEPTQDDRPLPGDD
jgi:vacuolar-type H+-ATPase subunit H